MLADHPGFAEALIALRVGLVPDPPKSSEALPEAFPTVLVCGGGSNMSVTDHALCSRFLPNESLGLMPRAPVLVLQHEPVKGLPIIALLGDRIVECIEHPRRQNLVQGRLPDRIVGQHNPRMPDARVGEALNGAMHQFDLRVVQSNFANEVLALMRVV